MGGNIESIFWNKNIVKFCALNLKVLVDIYIGICDLYKHIGTKIKKLTKIINYLIKRFFEINRYPMKFEQNILCL